MLSRLEENEKNIESKAVCWEKFNMRINANVSSLFVSQSRIYAGTLSGCLWVIPNPQNEKISQEQSHFLVSFEEMVEPISQIFIVQESSDEIYGFLGTMCGRVYYFQIKSKQFDNTQSHEHLTLIFEGQHSTLNPVAGITHIEFLKISSSLILATASNIYRIDFRISPKVNIHRFRDFA